MASLKRLLMAAFHAVVTCATNPTLLNKTGPTVYILGLTGIFGWGVRVAIPYVYQSYAAWICRCFQSLGCFLAFELMINWIGIVLVDSSYRVATKPLHEMSAEDNQNSYLSIHNSYGQEAGPHSATDTVLRRRYFTWNYCFRCNLMSPPRAHHCPICNRCILKRDHHCYVAARCIGFRNFRYFAVFIFYAVLATLFSLVHALPYAHYEVIPKVPNYLDILYPITLVRYCLGYVNLNEMILILLGWILLFYLIASLITFQNVYRSIVSGLTIFEIRSTLNVRDNRSISGKLGAVFGQYWWLNFLVPLHQIYPPIDDPLSWPTLSVS
ncbi:putative ZDHHC-type palmitoyltransferase 4 [Dreissena polymorpha]|nr:putative ZDHHC-type palmitoyltransferase 4 [Dreissena polymorpha]